MDCKGKIGNKCFNRFYKKHKHLCIEKTDERAVYSEKGTDKEIEKAVKEIQGVTKALNLAGVFTAVIIEK